jgi:tRNA nucleotidyltransferase (CCA-adding enzyme)
MSARLKVPLECRDAGRLAARWHRSVDRAGLLTPAALLDLLNAADALRRPERLDTLIDACASAALSLGAGGDYPPGAYLRAALVVAKGVDAAASARGAAKPRTRRKAGRDAIAAAVRAARIRALRAWKAARVTTA